MQQVPAQPPAVSCPADRNATSTAPVQPDYPTAAVRFHQATSVTVRVDVGADGDVKAIKVYKSSGVKAIDDAVVAAANSSKYVPKIANCKPVDGEYLFRADFNPLEVFQR